MCDELVCTFPAKEEEKKEPAGEVPQNTMAGTFDRGSLQMGATIQGTGLFGGQP